MNRKRHEHIVKNIRPGSIAEEMGIEPGDKLISIDGKEIIDVFDYHFLAGEEHIFLLMKKQMESSGN